MFATEFRKVLVLITLPTFLLTGCLQEKIDKELDKSISEEHHTHGDESLHQHDESEHSHDGEVEDTHLTEEQLHALEESDHVTPEEAAQSFVIDSRSEFESSAIKNLADSKDLNMVASYISQQFFLYHSKSIDAEEFISSMKLYFHTEFRTLLPEDDALLLQMFEMLQDMFVSQLGSPMTSYYQTDVQLMKQQTEANFYRKYVLKNGKEIYYQTLLKQDEQGNWLLVDDSPAPAYEILPDTENSFKETIIQSKGSGN